MKKAKYTTRFKKDLKRQKQRGKRSDYIKNIIEIICDTGDAPVECKPHNLIGNWQNYRECHIQPDWLLIYEVGHDFVIFYRTGSHSDLFK